jgi:hypothetical protein
MAARGSLSRWQRDSVGFFVLPSSTPKAGPMLKPKLVAASRLLTVVVLGMPNVVLAQSSECLIFAAEQVRDEKGGARADLMIFITPLTHIDCEKGQERFERAFRGAMSAAGMEAVSPVITGGVHSMLRSADDATVIRGEYNRVTSMPLNYWGPRIVINVTANAVSDEVPRSSASQSRGHDWCAEVFQRLKALNSPALVMC